MFKQTKKMTQPGLEPGIFWSEVRRVIQLRHKAIHNTVDEYR